MLTKLLKNNTKRNDISLHIPVKCIQSFNEGLHRLIDGRNSFIRENEDAHTNDISTFPRTQDGSIDLSAMSHHGYPKYHIRLEGGFSLKVEEICYSRANFSGSYDSLTIKRTAMKEPSAADMAAARKKNPENPEYPAPDFKCFSLNIPLRLIPALSRAVDYIYE